MDTAHERRPALARMLCQVCGTPNDDDREYCARCQRKLLVVSGDPALAEAVAEEKDNGFSFDEHLLERISLLEEAVQRTAETAQQTLRALHKQERSLLVHQAGLAALREILERRGVVEAGEWNDLWTSRLDHQLLALEKGQRFAAVRDRIAAFYRGGRRKVFEELLEDAGHALEAFDLERALEKLQAAHKLEPDNLDLACFLGETFFNDGRTDAALGFFEEALRSDPEHYQALVLTGVIHQERRETERAEELLRRALTLYPDAFLPLFSLGAVYAGRGELGKATLYLEKAVEREPVPQALYLLGSCLYEMGKPGAAIQRLEPVVRLDPFFEEAHHLLGLAYLDRGWTRKALDAFREAQRLNPRRLRYQDLVRYLSDGGSSPLPPVQGEAGRALRVAEERLAAGHGERAIASYRRAADLAPDNPTVLLSYALACLELKRHRETEALSRRVLELAPGGMLGATASAALMEALRGEGRVGEANRAGERLLAEGEGRFARTLAYYEMACNLAEMEDDLDRALDYARRALEQAPEELRQFPLAALGWVHYRRGEHGEAIEFLSRANELGGSPAVLTHLGMALLAAGEEQRARQCLASARSARGRGDSLERKMLECLKDSTRLLERVEEGRRRPRALGRQG